MVIHENWASAPTPILLISRGMMMVESIPGIMDVPIEVIIARLSRCLVSLVERGTIREWLSEYTAKAKLKNRL